MIPARSILLLFLAFLALAGPVRAQAGLFIVHLTIGPAWVADRAAQDQAGFGEHSQNLARLRRQGSLLVGARYQDQVADKGMLIIRAANRDEISAMFASDPMVRDRMFVLDIASLRPFLDGYVGRPAPAAASADAASLDGLNWLAGCWFGRNGKFEFREHWMRAAGGVMLGMGRTLMDGKLPRSSRCGSRSTSPADRSSRPSPRANRKPVSG